MTRAWTTRELATLHERGHLGATVLGHLLGRSPWSVRMQAARAGVSLRPARESVTTSGNPRPNTPDQKAATGFEGRPWTAQELANLRQLAHLGAPAVAAVLDRSVHAVRVQARRQRISLRKPGERRGRTLGELPDADARQVELLRNLRADQLEGRVSPARMERRVRLILAGAPLCPACGRRPIEVERTGSCADCYYLALADAHAMEPGTIEAKRTLDRERQRKHRRQAVGE